MVVKEGYKQTEIGAIPKDWDSLPTAKILQKNTVSIKIGPFGSQLKKEYLSVYGTFKVYGQENIYDNDFIIGERYIEKEKYKELKTCELKPGDIVISMMGTIGHCVIVPDGIQPGIMDSHLIRIRIDSNKVSPLFIRYSIAESESIQLQIQNLSVGGIMAGLNSNIIRQLVFVIPPLPEQKAIATALSDIDGLISSLTKLIEKKKNIKQGAMQDLLTGKKRLDGFSGEWVEVRLGDICERVTTGKLDANAMIPDGRYRFYTCAKEYYWINDYAFDGEALLISGNGANVGYIHYYKGKFNAYQRTYVLTGITQNIMYIKAYLDKHLADRISAEVNAGNTPYIKMGTLTDMVLFIPPAVEEQTAIATILSDMDSEVETQQVKLNKYKAIKQGMMQELLTGRIRLLEGA